MVDKDESALVGGMVGKARKENEKLRRIARTAPYYNRNRPHLCSFWAKGECNRGDACPYRHEMPSDLDSNFSQKAIRDRYYGVNDKLAEKILESANNMPKIEAPKNRAIVTLCIGGVNVYVNETDLYNHFFQFGDVKKVNIPQSNKEIAFVTFSTRQEAELAVQSCYGKLVINDQKLKVMWAKTPKPTKDGVWQYSENQMVESDSMFPHPDLISKPENVKTNDESKVYPSQNANQLGSKKD